MKKRLFFGMAMVLPALLIMMITLGAQARYTGRAAIPVSFSPGIADISVDGITDSPDPVVGTNVVEYAITVTNNGPGDSGDVFVNVYMNGGVGDIFAISGSGWTCTFGEGISCDRPNLTSGESSIVYVEVVAPNYDTTMTLHAHADCSSCTDLNPDNNDGQENTTVVVHSECNPGVVSCGTGHIDYGQNSEVTTGSVPNPSEWLVGTTFFKAVSGAPGGQTWSMFAPAVPDKCFIRALGLRCTWQMNMDPIPAVYPGPNVTFIAFCHVSHCKKSLIPGVSTLLLFKFDAAGHQHIIPPCPSPTGGTCFKTKRDLAGNLVITVKNLGGDPKLAGLCVGKGC